MEDKTVSSVLQRMDEGRVLPEHLAIVTFLSVTVKGNTCSKPSAIFSEINGRGKVIPLQPGVTQRVGRGIALLFHDRRTRRG